MPGFVADMDAAGPWQPRPIYLAMAEPNGPVEHAFFEALCTTWRDGLRALRGHIGWRLLRDAWRGYHDR